MIKYKKADKSGNFVFIYLEKNVQQVRVEKCMTCYT